MKRLVQLASTLGLLLASACVAPVGSNIEVPPDAAQTCAEHCTTVGMKLSALAIMANNVGCVCQPVGSAPEARTGSITAGMATIAMQNAARRQQQAQQAQQAR